MIALWTICSAVAIFVTTTAFMDFGPGFIRFLRPLQYWWLNFVGLAMLVLYFTDSMKKPIEELSPSMRFAHVNIIAKDSATLIAFYKAVFACQSIGETRDLRGAWLDGMTGVANAHIVGEHLRLPGGSADGPTLEIFSYDSMEPGSQRINQCGIAHLAFEVDDVERTLSEILAAGGGQLGEVVKTEYADGRKAVFVYATDPEGNIIELQSWT